MTTLAALILLVIYLHIRLTAVLNRRLEAVSERCKSALSKHDSLKCELESLRDSNLALTSSLEDTVDLYNIAKSICEPLDEDAVYAVLSSNMHRFIVVKECYFIKDAAQLGGYSDGYVICPFNVGQHRHRYLVFDCVRPEDEESLRALSGLFLLGLKRAFLYHKVQEMAVTDSLTGVFSRRYLLERLNEEFERSKKFGFSFSLLMLDIDHFKGYNDRYGHLAGDAILKEIALSLQENMRQIDLVGRFGGEEFSVILSETGKQGAALAAERMRQAIETREIKAYDETLKVTVSIGIACFPQDSIYAGELIDKADTALYRAKQSGRNKVCLFENPANSA